VYERNKDCLRHVVIDVPAQGFRCGDRVEASGAWASRRSDQAGRHVGVDRSEQLASRPDPAALSRSNSDSIAGKSRTKREFGATGDGNPTRAHEVTDATNGAERAPQCRRLVV
jgi:hypothetical protein